jgi:acetyltransferase-like isoleucine patch superfamily enzyme
MEGSMIQSMRVAAKKLTISSRGMLTRTATLIGIVVYPLFEFSGSLHYRGARHFALKRFVSVAPDVQFDPIGGHIRYEGLQVGSNTFLGTGARIWALKDIRIGNDVMFGPEVYVMDGYHRIDVIGKTIRDSGADERQPVVIDDDVWVGTRTTIMKGVRIGQGSVIGAESLVTKSLPPYVIAGGNPCRVIRKRFSNAELAEHLRILGVSPVRAETLIHERAMAVGERCPCGACQHIQNNLGPTDRDNGRESA